MRGKLGIVGSWSEAVRDNFLDDDRVHLIFLLLQTGVRGYDDEEEGKI